MRSHNKSRDEGREEKETPARHLVYAMRGGQCYGLRWPSLL
jgi:hypothetical protein